MHQRGAGGHAQVLQPRSILNARTVISNIHSGSNSPLPICKWSTGKALGADNGAKTDAKPMPRANQCATAGAHEAVKLRV
eukprot:2985190-Amphidinium_carterae.1